ncbi:MAG TPA: hypothetical protein VL547_07730 [Dinghuibacter sp.]|uniref:hypothetical protein n=1 Tax=Dinghuibacter sp. TaxID=2024697 RepID=UPI002BE0D549|nr:hypothetical protein [Dinghuibacter sp.]HTJ11898.1 hypothetical protein [Dinghuibacter sp.]
MKEFYLFVTVCGVFMVSLINHATPVAGPHHNRLSDTLPVGTAPDLESMIPVNEGDTFSVRVNLPGEKNRSILTNGLRALGAGTAAYGLIQHESEGDKKIATVARRSYVLPVIGTGMALSAGKLTHLGKGVHAYLKYTLYDKHLGIISNGVIPLNARLLKKGQPVFTGTALQDGYLEAMVVSNDPVALPIKATPLVTVVSGPMVAIDRTLPGFVSNTGNLVVRPTADMPVMRPKPIAPVSFSTVVGDIQRSGVKRTHVPAMVTIPAPQNPPLPESIGNSPAKLPHTPAKPIFHRFIPYYVPKKEGPGDEEGGGEGGTIGPDPRNLELFDEDDDDGDDDDGGGGGDGGEGGGDGGDPGSGDSDDDDSDDDDADDDDSDDDDEETEEDVLEYGDEEDSGDGDAPGGDPRFSAPDIYYKCDLRDQWEAYPKSRRKIPGTGLYVGVNYMIAEVVSTPELIDLPGGGWAIMVATANSPFIASILPPLPNPGPCTVTMGCNVTETVYTYNSAGVLVSTSLPFQYESFFVLPPAPKLVP